MKTPITLIAYMVLFALSSCALKKEKNTENEMSAENLFDKKWKLVELHGKPVADKVNGNEPYLSFDKTTKRYSASGGCNGLGGTFEMNGNQIKFSQGVSTMMACMDMSVENGLKTLFGNTVRFSLLEDSVTNSSTLTLYRDNTTLARFSSAENKALASLDGTWELDYISGPRIAFEGLYPNNRPTIRFDSTNSQVSGNGSCNNYTGTVTISGSKITFGSIASTKMMCPHIKGEDLYFQTLQKVNAFSVQENQLSLIMGDVAIMRFNKK